MNYILEPQIRRQVYRTTGVLKQHGANEAMAGGREGEEEREGGIQTQKQRRRQGDMGRGVGGLGAHNPKPNASHPTPPISRATGVFKPQNPTP